MPNYQLRHTGAVIDDAISKALTALQEMPEHTHDATDIAGTRVYNLLDNSDFRNPVNQRGTESGTSLSSGDYVFDRWVMAENGTPTFGSSGLSTNAEIRQNMLKAAYIGKALTAVVWYTDGTKLVRSAVVPDTNTLTDIISAGSFKLTVSGDLLVFRLMSNASKTIKYVGLYEGAFTDSTAPEYSYKGYAAEYAECRRYYRYYTGYTLAGIANTTSVFVCQFDISGMRIFPSLAHCRVTWLKHEGTQISDGLTGQLNGTMEGRIEVVSTTSLTKMKVGAAYFSSFALSADL